MTDYRTSDSSQEPAVTAVSNPLTLVLPIKSKEDEQQLRAILSNLQGGSSIQNPVSLAMDQLGTVHDARFVFLDSKLLVITTYDHDFETYIDAFVNEIGQICDSLLSHVTGAPKLPVRDNRGEFLQYVQKNDLRCFGKFYSGYPSLSRRDVVGLAQAAIGNNASPADVRQVANPLTLAMTIKSKEDVEARATRGRPARCGTAMTIKSKEDVEALKGLLTQLQPNAAENRVAKAMDQLGTVQNARFVFLGEDKLLVITTYDHDFETYLDAFVNEIGGIFDALLSHVVNAPRLPVSNHRKEFQEYVRKNDLRSFGGFYSGYPTLSTRDIRLLQQGTRAAG